MPEIGPAELVTLPFAYVLPCPPLLLGHQKIACEMTLKSILSWLRQLILNDVILQRPMIKRNKFEK